MSQQSSRLRIFVRSHTMHRLIFGPSVVILLVVAGFLIVSLASVDLGSTHKYNTIIESLAKVSKDIAPSSIYFLPGLALSLLIYGLSLIIYYYFVDKGDHKQLISALSEETTKSRVVQLCLIAFCATGGILALTALYDGTWVSVLDRLVNNPGGIFAIVTGALSVIGVWLTLFNVVDTHNSIVNFQDFIDRVESLFDETDDNDLIMMMVLTPAMGCLVLPPDKWTPLTEKIQSSKKNISLTCLSSDVERVWFNSYKLGVSDGDKTKLKDKLKDMDDRISVGIKASESIRDTLKSRHAVVIERINTQAQAIPPSDMRRARDKKLLEDIALLEVSWDEMPHTYYVANRKVAIIVSPLFLPRPLVNIFDGTFHNREVTMIGFETRQIHIVDSIHKEIRTRRNKMREARGA